MSLCLSIARFLSVTAFGSVGAGRGRQTDRDRQTETERHTDTQTHTSTHTRAHTHTHTDTRTPNNVSTENCLASRLPRVVLSRRHEHITISAAHSLPRADLSQKRRQDACHSCWSLTASLCGLRSSLEPAQAPSTFTLVGSYNAVRLPHLSLSSLGSGSRRTCSSHTLSPESVTQKRCLNGQWLSQIFWRSFIRNVGNDFLVTVAFNAELDCPTSLSRNSFCFATGRCISSCRFCFLRLESWPK